MLWRSNHQYATAFLGIAIAWNHWIEGQGNSTLHFVSIIRWFLYFLLRFIIFVAAPNKSCFDPPRSSVYTFMFLIIILRGFFSFFVKKLKKHLVSN
jgi:hypothetical protein